MKTLFPSYRVSDLDRSLEFYSRLGYRCLGTVALGDGSRLAMLLFPQEPAVSLELVHRPADGPVRPGGFDHLAVQVDDLAATLAHLTRNGLRPGPPEWPAGEAGPRTAMLDDPDGYRIELVQWPPGHPDGITAADFPAAQTEPAPTTEEGP
jgi:lactoylglutathione lyase